MAHEYCLTERVGPVFIVTINRPERRNALDRAANFELGEVFDDFEGNPACRVAIITGAGPAFCAGADLKASTGSPTQANASDLAAHRAAVDDAVPSSGFGGLAARFDRIKPVIAAVNGFAMGGGFEIALACDLVIASEEAVFGLPEPRVGLLAGSGGIPRLYQELGPKRANSIVMTGRRVPAPEALAMGLVNEVVPREQLLVTANRYAEWIMECSPAALRAARAVVGALHGSTVEDSMTGMWDLPAVQAMSSSPDFVEGRLAFAEKRQPRWSDL